MRKDAAVNPESWGKTGVNTLVLSLATSPSSFRFCNIAPVSWLLFAGAGTEGGT